MTSLPTPDPLVVITGPDPEHLIRREIPRRMRGVLPGCAAGTWLDALDRPRYATGGIVSPGAVTINMAAPPPSRAPQHLVDEAFAAGRLYERRRR